MFKKTLLALALTGLAGTAAAATIDNTAANYSVEGLQFQTEVDLADVVATIKASTTYQAGDKIVFTFPNDTFAVGTAAVLTADAGTLSTAAPTPVYSGGNKVSFTLDAGTASITDGVVLTLAGIKLSAANLNAGGKVDVAYEVISAVTNGAYDKATATTVATVAKQLDVKAGASVLDAKVDVSNERKEFVGGAFTDTLEIAATNDTALEEGATVTKAVYTINGDFSFLDTDADDKADYSVTSTVGTVAVAKDLQSITVTHTAAAAAIVTIEATDGTTVIPTRKYTVDAEVTYTAVGATAAQTKSFSFDGGEWKLNGYEGTVSFLPFGGGESQLITVTNSGALEGKITGELIVDGEVKSIDLGMAKAKAVTNVGKLVKQYAADNAIVGNYAVKIIVDAPADNITVEGIYFLNGDRVLVPTTQK